MKAILIKNVRFLTLFFSLLVAGNSQAQESVSVMLKTNLGNIAIELFPKKAPKTVENFLSYVEEGYYSGTIFHRVIDGFMIQGGGHDTDMNKKATKTPVVNEAQAFVPNARGTIAMARTNDPHSATSQFFINVANNKFLNKSASNPGYAVFGKVTQGMGVIDKIAKTRTAPQGAFRDAPVEQVQILSIERIK